MERKANVARGTVTGEEVSVTGTKIRAKARDYMRRVRGGTAGIGSPWGGVAYRDGRKQRFEVTASRWFTARPTTPRPVDRDFRRQYWARFGAALSSIGNAVGVNQWLRHLVVGASKQGNNERAARESSETAAKEVCAPAGHSRWRPGGHGARVRLSNVLAFSGEHQTT